MSLTHTERLRERAFAFTEPEFSLDQYADVELSRRSDDGDGNILSPCEFTEDSKIFFAVYLHWEDHNGHTSAEWQADFWRVKDARLFATYLSTQCLLARIAEGKDFERLLDAIFELPECPIE